MYCRVAALAGAILLFVSCAKPPLAWRTAVLRFENLRPRSPDSGWIGRALSEAIAGQLEGTRHNAVISFAALHQLDDNLGARPSTAPGVSSELPAAIGGGANRIVTGYFELRDSRLSIHASEEDLDTHAVRPLAAEGSLEELLHLTATIATAIDDEARPPITGSARALRSYSLALESAADARRGLLEEAVRLDPDFGKPYVALAQDALARRDAAAFARILSEVRGRGEGVRAIDRSELNLDDARLHADANTRIDALGALVRSMPADPFRLRELGLAELEGNRYAEAADHFRKLANLLPASAEPLNFLGYAQMYSGDAVGARRSFELYRRADIRDANALDSSGDAEFFFGDFAKAEGWYLKARNLNPLVAGGAEYLKIAWTHLMRGNRNRAKELVDSYRKQPGADPARAAQVLRAAGDREAAYALLAATPGNAAAEAQSRWWRFLDGTGPAPEGTSRQARALITVARKDYQAALPIWRDLAENSPPEEWWTRAVYARVLKEAGQTQESARYAKSNPIPRPERTLSFDELWFSWLLETRHAKGKVE